MLSLVVSLLCLAHPFHVSVSDIKYKEEQKAIQISTRIFLDDLEVALQAFTGNEALDIVDKSNWEVVKTSLEQYILSKIAIEDAKGRKLELHYVGAEIEDDVMWCYLEVLKVKKLPAVSVTNKLLHEVWPDQENLVHFRAFDSVKSARLYKGEETKLFSWD